MNLQVQDLSFSIGETAILNNITLEVQDGEFVGLAGSNGCGKSTLLKHIYRTYRPDRRTVFLDKTDTLDLSNKQLARSLAVMAQETTVEFDLTVFDMVLHGRYAHKKFLEGTSAADKALCRHCLHEVGLDGYEYRNYLSLSGGEKQRVLLARVLMQESEVVVLDEPTNHLDIRYQYQIIEILKRQNITVFASIHDLNLAALYCDRLLLMKDGAIVAAGRPEQVLTPETIWCCFHIHAQVSKNPLTKKLQICYLPSWVTLH